jgi:hypothetical protein
LADRTRSEGDAVTARHLVIADYSADWPDKFKSEAEQLARILGPRYTDCPAECDDHVAGLHTVPRHGGDRVKVCVS